MRVFATISADGTPTGFYPDDIFPSSDDGELHVGIPVGAIELTDVQYDTLRDGDGSKLFVEGAIVDRPPAAAPLPTVPDQPSLSDWRTALILWGRLDQVDAAIAALKADADPTRSMYGKIAEQRFQFANNVFRKQLLGFKDMLGFTSDEVDESLWRADRVSQDDLSGVWPLPST